jgi:hypothetical protein
LPAHVGQAEAEAVAKLNRILELLLADADGGVLPDEAPVGAAVKYLAARRPAEATLDGKKRFDPPRFQDRLARDDSPHLLAARALRLALHVGLRDLAAVVARAARAHRVPYEPSRA